MLTKTKIGQWSVGLTLFYWLLLIVFFAFMAMGLVTFDAGHWWDWTVAMSVPLVLSAFITGFIAVKKYQDKSTLSYLALLINSGVILFLLLHSLFIND